jgi:hypothetical protein
MHPAKTIGPALTLRGRWIAVGVRGSRPERPTCDDLAREDGDGVPAVGTGVVERDGEPVVAEAEARYRVPRAGLVLRPLRRRC